MPYRPNLVAVLRRHFAALAEGRGASLVHCFAGKDRTGMSVALTHHVLGVHPDDAMADYLLTNAAMAGRQFRGATGEDSARYAALEPAAAQALGGVAAEYLEAGFAALRDSHGSVDAYLADVLGVDAAVQERIRAALVE
jgi:protein tyrosine/serine phosphatase